MIEQINVFYWNFISFEKCNIVEIHRKFKQKYKKKIFFSPVFPKNYKKVEITRQDEISIYSSRSRSRIEISRRDETRKISTSRTTLLQLSKGEGNSKNHQTLIKIVKKTGIEYWASNYKYKKLQNWSWI